MWLNSQVGTCLQPIIAASKTSGKTEQNTTVNSVVAESRSKQAVQNSGVEQKGSDGNDKKERSQNSNSDSDKSKSEGSNEKGDKGNNGKSESSEKSVLCTSGASAAGFCSGPVGGGNLIVFKISNNASLINDLFIFF